MMMFSVEIQLLFGLVDFDRHCITGHLVFTMGAGLLT